MQNVFLLNITELKIHACNLRVHQWMTVDGENVIHHTHTRVRVHTRTHTHTHTHTHTIEYYTAIKKETATCNNMGGI